MRNCRCFAALLFAFAMAQAPGVAQSRVIVSSQGPFDTRFGWSTALAGDVDGDGRNDLLVGSEYGSGSGSATIQSGLDGSELRRHDGEQASSYFGQALARLDDVNGDAIFDYVVSAPQYYDSVARKWIGKIYVYSGSDGALIWSTPGFGNSRGWGTQLAPVGDVDGDGATDFVINKPGGGAAFGGRLELLSGAYGASIWIVDTIYPHVGFGAQLARVRDVDGDGIDDVAATMPDYSEPNHHGAVQLCSGRNGALIWQVLADLVDDSPAALSDAGDVDGDGTHDVAIGYPASGHYYGAVKLHSGIDGHLLGTISGDWSGASLGTKVSDGFDADGDGDPDLAISRIDSNSVPRLSLYDARSTTLLAEIDQLPYQSPTSMTLAGDLDGDGFGDLIVGFQGSGTPSFVNVYTMRSPPALTSVTPSRGDHHAATPVTISGSGFLLAQSLTVNVGANAATNVTVVDDATLTCTAPAGAAGLDDVVVSDDAGSATLAGGFAATPALRIDGDPVVGGTLTLRFLCNPGDDLSIVAGLPPIVTIPTPPYEGALCIFPFLPVVYMPGWSSDEFDLVGSIPNDPALSGQHFLVQALVGAPLTGAGKNGSWTNCGDVAIQ